MTPRRAEGRRVLGRRKKKSRKLRRKGDKGVTTQRDPDYLPIRKTEDGAEQGLKTGERGEEEAGPGLM